MKKLKILTTTVLFTLIICFYSCSKNETSLNEAFEDQTISILEKEINYISYTGGLNSGKLGSISTANIVVNNYSLNQILKQLDNKLHKEIIDLLNNKGSMLNRVGK